MKHIFFIFFFALCTIVSAADFRIDVSGIKGTVLRPLSASPGVTLTQASWLGARKDTRMSCTAEVSSQWKEFSFTFIPKKDGKYEVSLMSSKAKVKVCCDDVKADGAEIKNGSFDLADAQGNPSNWKKIGNPSVSNNFSITTHDDRWMQIMVCKAGEPVTITFKARAL